MSTNLDCFELKSSVVYRFKGGSCNAAYYGKTKRQLKIRVSEHMGDSPLTGKKVNTGFQSSAIKDHMLVCDHRLNLDDFSILANSGNNFVLELKESLSILRDNPLLNKTISSVPLYLFK